jgi:tetratricopeptide (TPR) repeat protein
MKRWHLSGYVFLVVVAALLLSVAVGAQDTCEEADALYNLKLYDEAQEAYIELLKNNTDLTCAQIGINKSRQKKAEEFYNLGEEYREARQYDLARSAYIEALKINSSYNESHVALAWVSGDPFAAVRTLADMGRYTEAEERLKKVIEKNPGIDVPEELEYLLGEKIFFWRLPWWIRPLGELVLILAIVFLVVRRIYNLRKPRLDIEDFDKGATNLDIGKGLAAMVEVSFKQIGESGAHGSRPSLIAGPIEKFEIPADVKSVHPYIKIMTQLFEWVFRPDVFTLSGYLQKPGGDLGAGLTLSLVRKKTGEIIANRTIWQKDFDPAITPPKEKDPAPYYRLAEPAAIWTLFHDELPFKKKLTLLGTRDWLSFAYFRAGVRWAREERDDKARKLYVEALNQDTDNRGAWFNLGALDVEAGEYKRAIKRLQMAREKYLFCWSKIPRNVSMGDIPGDDSRKLRRFLVDDRGILWAENAEIIRSRNDNTISIRENGYSAEIKLDRMEEKAVLKIRDGRPADLKVEMENGEPNIYAHFLKEPVWYKAAYQLAATYHYWSRQKEDENTPKNLRELAAKEAKKLYEAIEEAIKALQKSEDKALRNFLKSFEPMAAIMYAAILADNNEKEEARGIVENIDTTKLTYRGHYNMACYYAETKDDEKAWEHLEYALERGGDIVQWAKNDPSLKRLREDTEGEFDKLIEKYFAPVMPSADLLPLAGLRLIDDLILKADTPEARKKLAKKLCINDKFLQRWALLADMMRIVGIDTQYANLLEAAGVRSLDDLANIPRIDTLVDLLCKLNDQCLVKQLLSVEIVKQWKKDANVIARKVMVYD